MIPRSAEPLLFSIEPVNGNGKGWTVADHDSAHSEVLTSLPLAR